jgi:hypothetical protein
MHFDALLRHSVEAQAFWRADPVASFARLGVVVRELRRERRF